MTMSITWVIWAIESNKSACYEAGILNSVLILAFASLCKRIDDKV